nr:MAG TPA: hypothetical protein [Caudoviricetes sp.]
MISRRRATLIRFATSSPSKVLTSFTDSVTRLRVSWRASSMYGSAAKAPSSVRAYWCATSSRPST